MTDPSESSRHLDLIAIFVFDYTTIPNLGVLVKRLADNAGYAKPRLVFSEVAFCFESLIGRQPLVQRCLDWAENGIDVAKWAGDILNRLSPTYLEPIRKIVEEGDET